MWVENNAKNKQKGRAKKAASTSASAVDPVANGLAALHLEAPHSRLLRLPLEL